MKRNDRLNVTMTVEWDSPKASRKHFLKSIVEKNNYKTMAEVGVRRGGTTFYLLDSFPELTIYAIDTDIRQFYNSDVKKKYGDRLIPIQAMSWDAAITFEDNSLDLVFIDADHSYESVKRDIIAYTPKLKSTGKLTGHDIDYPGVNKAVTELIKEFDIGPNFVWVKK